MKTSRNTKRTKGFTLAEMMIVIAIIAILAALIFIGVQTYMRSLNKLEYDNYAKELFIVAQNHLSMAKAQNYLDRAGYGTEDPNEDGVYYFVVPPKSNLTDSNSLLGLMLPPGSIDETVRRGNYIVRYFAETGTILDVFYWTDDGRYPHTYSDGDYTDFFSKRNDKDALKTYESDSSVIGYYGGAEAASLALEQELKAPEIRVKNAERLVVTVTETNDTDVTNEAGYTLKLTVKGANGGVKTYTLNATTDPRVSVSGRTYTIVLDDITIDGRRFADIAADEGAFVPGEDLTVTAVATSSAKLSNIAESATLRTNSLFGDATDVTTDPSNGTAEIANIRHLENLNKAVSGVNDGVSPAVKIASARQTTDLNWDAFKTAIGNTNCSVYDAAGNATAAGTFLPVTPGYALSYDGLSHTIANVTAQAGTEDAGLFGTLADSSVSNLKLLDFTVAGGNAGALAGTVSNSNLTNVVAVNTAGSSFATVNATGSAGGLVGSATNSEFSGCAASLGVRSSGGNAGGLIGTASGGSEVTGCYSGGRTANGAYSTTAYNVTGSGATGGLIGDAGDTAILASYSTCSASGGVTGGLVGTSRGTIRNSYATGLVSGTGATGAFAGTMTGTAADCNYYEIINELANPAGGYMYRAATGAGAKAGVAPFDANAGAYNDFVGPESGWEDASPYDGRLKLYYSGKYPLPTVEDLLGGGTTLPAGAFVAVHTGDWPAPELLVVNVGE